MQAHRALIRLILCLALLLPGTAWADAFGGVAPAPSNVTGLFVTTPNGSTPTVGAAIGAVNGLQPLREFGQRALYPGSYVGAGIHSGGRTSGTYRVWDRVNSRAGVGGEQFCFSNSFTGLTAFGPSGGNGEFAAGNPITIGFSLELNTNPAATAWTNNTTGAYSIPFTFNHQHLVTIPPNKTACTDVEYISLAPSQAFYDQTFISESIAGFWPITSPGNTALFDGSNLGGPFPITLSGNGTVGPYTGTFNSNGLPVIPGSLQILGGPITTTATDNGSGTITGTGIASGTVNYTTGAVSITLSSTMAAGTNISINAYGGSQPTPDQTGTTNFTTFEFTQSGQNGNFGPISALGIPLKTGNSLRAIAAVGDSIVVGNCDTPTTQSWFDFSNSGVLGQSKYAISGEAAAAFADPRGRYRRMGLLAGTFNRIFGDWGTNDLVAGQTLSQLWNNLFITWNALGAVAPDGPSDIWWMYLNPRTVSGTNMAPINVTLGPYTGTAAFGPGVVSNGIRFLAPIVGNGSQTTFTFTVPTPYLIGTLFAVPGGPTTVIDPATGVLTGTQIASGTINSTTGVGSITFVTAPAAGAGLVIGYSADPTASARNAHNNWLSSFALARGLIAGLLDQNPVIELVPGSATGTGDGQWASSSLSCDGTHEEPNTHQVIVPGYLGPSGTNPSPLWSFQ